MKAYIEGMPKVELHTHIEGTLEPELKFKLAERNRMTLPCKTVEEMRAAYTFNDLTSFLGIYYEGMNVLITEADFFDLTMAYLAKAHSQHVVYTEIFFDPQAHTSRGVSFETCLTGIRRAMAEAEKKLGIRSNLIMCFLRDMGAPFAMATLLQALPYKDQILGVGLDSDEKGHPPVEYRKVFARARAEGFKLTMHCDVNQLNSIEHVRQCLDVIRVDRLDHGVNSLESDILCTEIARRGLGLTVCPVSNGYVVDDLCANEIKAMLDRGMRVTINSDDPAYFGGYITENILAVQQAVNLDKKAVNQLTANAIDASWLPDADKAMLHAKLSAYAEKG